MKRIITRGAILILLGTILIPAPARADFNGRITMDLTMPNGQAMLAYLFGRNDQRMDMTTRLERIPDPLETTVITRKTDPDRAIILNHKAGTYTRINLRDALEQATLVDFDQNYKLRNLGRKNISDYETTHIVLESRTDRIEMWLSRDVADFQTFRLLQAQSPRLSNTGLAQAITGAGVDGFPIRIVQINETGTITMQVTGVESMQPPRSEFRVPDGYSEVTGTRRPLDTTQKEHLREVMEKIKQFETTP
ncbi:MULTISPECIES: DUF4412 domain-containing protein [Prosthecochloris]|uniref:DUF4412 domain-containing protein n=1 Tax=Prosthecochloris vibrioformis TaxID=1098 RepID=A0A5C4S3B3_PROVB|nr:MULTISPECIES: DUF4412 domain-containing protein [Prosthecochloris]ANT64421.1 hypothetical protein Ptc2401_00623 [Prosthecochloris sp. CIB 2401]TNJ37271.1 DUF4412 domain-containing protein [Prosthecochloris vibrioformis]